MNCREFCYWLQSSFELMDAKGFNEEQTQLIKMELNNALKDNGIVLRNYCVELKGYFDLVQPTIIDQKTTEILKDKLDKLFIHVVPLSNTDREPSTKSNRLRPSLPPGVQAMC